MYQNFLHKSKIPPGKVKILLRKVICSKLKLFYINLLKTTDINH